MNNTIKSGIYKITNIESGKFYIGSSKNIEKRFSDHSRDLRKNEHQNIILQRSWNLHGSGSFVFEIMEECDPQECLKREQYYLDLMMPYMGVGYNINTCANGGDSFTYHPNKEEMREKNRILSTGENNGMFGRTHSPDTIQKQKAKAQGRFSLQWFIEKHGEELGTQKYHDRRQMLSNREINYKHDNGLTGKRIVVESTRGDSVSRGRNALKDRKVEFSVDILNLELSSKQIADKYKISTAAVKYHRKKNKV